MAVQKPAREQEHPQTTIRRLRMQLAAAQRRGGIRVDRLDEQRHDRLAETLLRFADGVETLAAEPAELLYGAKAIAEFLAIPLGPVRNRIDRGQLPTFKMAGTVCARRTSLNAWLAAQEEKGRAG